jgi:uncharacterized protein involved in exopolysaccharide biosynthesis
MPEIISAPIESTFVPPEREVSMLTLASTVLRRRRFILALGFIGGVLGGLVGLLSTRTYTSTASFLAQAADQGNAGGLAAAASQLGIRVPTSGPGWSPALYAQIARSRSVLGPIAADTFTVPEAGNGPIRTIDLLKVKGKDEATRLALGAQQLTRMVQTSEVKPLGTVSVTVTTPWPSFSMALADRVLQRLNAFNVETRRSQATSEREFVDQQVSAAEKALRGAENRMQEFLQNNRAISAPHLQFDRDRLQREVTMAQSVYTTLLQSREEARIREVRDTPVITVLEEPRVPLKGNSRGGLLKAIGGSLLGVVLAMLWVFVAEAVRSMRATGSKEAEEFFGLLDQAVPMRAKPRATKV